MYRTSGFPGGAETCRRLQLWFGVHGSEKKRKWRPGRGHAPGGLCALVTVVMAGRLSSVLQPKYLMTGAFCVIAISTYRFTGLTPQVSFGWMAFERAI